MNTETNITVSTNIKQYIIRKTIENIVKLL